MKYLPLAVALLLIPGCNHHKDTASSSRSGDTPSSRGPADRDFMIEAAQANHAEVDAGRLAVGKTANDSVREFANHMIEDHSAASLELRNLAMRKEFRVPETPDQTHLKKVARLGEITGAEFDRKYVEMMVDDHIQAVRLFEMNSKKAKDDDVRAWAMKMLPALEKHLKMARELNAKVSGTTP